MSTAAVAAALTASPRDVGARLLTLPEDQWFDRKAASVSPEKIANIQAAFANAEGGVIIVGLSSGRVQGTRHVPDRMNAIRQAAIDLTVPTVRHAVERVACINDSGADDELLAIWVEPSERVHANARDEVYLRVGDETRRLTFDERRQLLYDKGEAAFEAEPVRGTSFADLDEDLVARYARRVEHPDPRRLLQTRDLLTRDGELTTAGVLLFGKAPERWFPQAYVRVIRHLGTVRETGSRQQIVFDRRYVGPLSRQIEAARRTVQSDQPRRRALGSGARFRQLPVVPENAWSEAIVNAVVHRSYSNSGDHIRVEMFEDRIEVASPGRFPGLVSVDHPLEAQRFARNPRIARVAFDLGFVQELGEGIRRMFEEMRRNGLVDPAYHQTSGSVRVVLSGIRRGELAADVPDDTATILFALREAPVGLRTGDIADVLRISRPTAISRLTTLRDAGLIEWVGRSPRDPRAYWRLPSR